MKQLVHQLVGAIRRLLTQPLGELNRWQLAARYAVGLCRYGTNQLKEDRATQMAAALTYRTIFSMVPLSVLALLVFNAFGGFQSVGGDLQDQIYGYLGLDAIELRETQARAEQGEIVETPDKDQAPLGVDAAPADPKAVERGKDADAATPDEEQTKARVDQLLADLQAQVAGVDFKSIGLVGLGLLIWAGLSLVVSLENSFNRIYHAPAGRAWHLRITIYWAVITLGPVLVALSFFLTNQLLDLAGSFDAFGLLSWVVNLFAPLASTAATWLLLILIYKLLPNAKVQLRAALIGALMAAILWEASKWGFRIYINKAVGYSALYGSLGLVPLFLLWMYVTWMVILFGLEISYVVQTVKGTDYLRANAHDNQTDRLVETSAVLRIARAVGQAFDQGQAITFDALTQDTRLHPTSLRRLLAALESHRHLHRQETDDEEADPPYTLSRPAEQITLRDLIHAARSTTAPPTGDELDIIQQPHASEAQALANRTLRDLLPAPENDQGDDDD